MEYLIQVARRYVRHPGDLGRSQGRLPEVVSDNGLDPGPLDLPVHRGGDPRLAEPLPQQPDHGFAQHTRHVAVIHEPTLRVGQPREQGGDLTAGASVPGEHRTDIAIDLTDVTRHERTREGNHDHPLRCGGAWQVPGIERAGRVVQGDVPRPEADRVVVLTHAHSTTDAQQKPKALRIGGPDESRGPVYLDLSIGLPAEHLDHQVTDLVDHHCHGQLSRWLAADGDRRELTNRR